VKQQTEKFDKTIKKPLSAAKPKDKNGRIRISNSFDTIGLEDTLEEEFTLRTPTTFLDVFENTLSNWGKGNEKMGEYEKNITQEKGFSPTILA
jgi:hypothetical protein